MSLKCWYAGSVDPFEYDHVEVVFARSYREAKKIVWEKGENIQAECGDEFINLRLKRKPEHDHLAVGLEPYVPWDAETLRPMGWRLDGDNTCSSCGLAEWDGEYPVCSGCDQCIECGCDDDCEEKEQGGEDE